MADRFDSSGEATLELFDYIEVFYNQRRLHSTLGQISPATFERRAAWETSPIWNVVARSPGGPLMKALLALTVLLLSATPAALLAQGPAPSPVQPPHRARVSADQLLEGQSAMASFDALHAILDTGYEVVVRDAAGRKTRGRVSSISDDQIVIFGEGTTPLLRLTKPAVERRFPADSVTRIDIVDSTWNGTLIGAAAGVGLAFGIARWEESAVPNSNSMKGLGTVVFGGLSIVVSSAVGHLIDLSMNAPIYERPSTPRVSLVPLLGRERIGLMARVHF